MIKNAIVKKIDDFEKRVKKRKIPIVIFIRFDEAQGSWIAEEKFGHNSKFIKIKSPDDYEVPEGYDGTIIIEGVLED